MNNWIKKNDSINSIKNVFLSNTGIASLDEANNWYKKFYADSYQIKDMNKAVELVKKYKNKNIVVVGDYDVDGQTSISILYLTLKSMGYNVAYRIPHRFSEGFGINCNIVDEIPEGSLIITCDNGIAQVEAINYARDNDFEVIIIDHHEPMVENDNVVMPYANVIIDPVALKGTCEFDGYCGAGLCYKFARMFLDGNNDELLVKLQTLAAIGTIADVMPLTNENYALVRIALGRMNQPQYCTTGTYALLNATKLVSKEISSKDVGFSIAPVLNSISRLNDKGAEDGVKLLTILDESKYHEALNSAEACIRMNDERKQLQNELFEVAKEEVLNNFADDIPIVLYLKEAAEGLLGPIAAKIAEEFKRPAFVVTETPYDDILKGSARSYGNYDIKAELDKISDLLYRYGGHTGAAGLSVERQNLEEVRKALNKNASGYEYSSDLYYDLEISMDEIPAAIDELKKYAPYGEGNPEPVFYIPEFITLKDNRKNEFFTFMGKSGKSVKLFGCGAEAVNFTLAEKVAEIANKHPEMLTSSVKLEMIGTLSNNIFNGRITRQIEFKDVRFK